QSCFSYSQTPLTHPWPLRRLSVGLPKPLSPIHPSRKGLTPLLDEDYVPAPEHPNDPVSGNPDARVSGHPSVPAPEDPNDPVSGHPDTHAPGHPDAHVSWHPNAHVPGNPDAHVSGHLSVPAPEHPNDPVSGHPDTHAPGHPDAHVSWPTFLGTRSPLLPGTSMPMLSCPFPFSLPSLPP
uniref:Uncharacterized protein n=1 Tax=Pseudonaja textilis TaxID=8673 RepID=A0A670XMU8_PSETE